MCVLLCMSSYAMVILGYYMATLEAATQHIVQMADEYTLAQAQPGKGTDARTDTAPSALPSSSQQQQQKKKK